MTTTPTLHELVARRRELSAELAASLREYGEVRSAAIIAHSRAFRDNYQHMNVTDRREACKLATADLDADAAKLDTECKALTVEIEQLDVEIEVRDADA